MFGINNSERPSYWHTRVFSIFSPRTIKKKTALLLFKTRVTTTRTRFRVYSSKLNYCWLFSYQRTPEIRRAVTDWV